MGAEPHVYLVSGTQGAGKTTVAGALARRFERGAHVPADVLHKMIASGIQWPRTPAQAEAAGADWKAQLNLRLRNACLLARSFYEGGFTVVVDDIIIGDGVAQLRVELAGIPYTLVTLVPRRDVVIERERGRGSALYETWNSLTDAFLDAPRDRGVWVDSSELSVEQTVDAILAATRATAGVTR